MLPIIQYKNAPMIVCPIEQQLETVTEIDTGVFLGNNNVAQNLEFLRVNGIKGILNCSKDLPFYFMGTELETQISTMRIPLDDKPENVEKMYNYFEPALDFINQNKPVFIHCFAGMSRSPTICAVYLMKSKKIGPNEAVQEIMSKRPFAFNWGKMFYFADAINRFYLK